jgi:hypothetical protein
VPDGQTTQGGKGFGQRQHFGEIEFGRGLRSGDDRHVPGLTDQSPQPVGGGQIRERDPDRLHRVVDRPRQDGAADLKDRHLGRCIDVGPQGPQSGIDSEFHPVASNSSIALMRCR